nr:unnamed protein product [Digitaria exilis]
MSSAAAAAAMAAGAEPVLRGRRIAKRLGSGGWRSERGQRATAAATTTALRDFVPPHDLVVVSAWELGGSNRTVAALFVPPGLLFLARSAFPPHRTERGPLIFI